MINVDDWAPEIRRLHFAKGIGIKIIARQRGIARNTVRDAVWARSGLTDIDQRARRKGRPLWRR
jgi:hypothetical protein